MGERNQLQIEFGREASRAEVVQDGAVRFILEAPVLRETGPFRLRLPEGRVMRSPGCLVRDSGDLVVGFLRGAPDKGLEAATGAAYDQLLRVVGNRFLYRVWHFVPRINAWENNLENYRLFCRGRADAFSRILGSDCHPRLSAASAVGSGGEDPIILFIAGTAEPRHVENPEQVPAYSYPPVYGPRSPSFARASRVALPPGEVAFISGTASIKGSDTVHPHHCEEQVGVTLHNLALIGESAGIGSDLGLNGGAVRRFVVYLRHQHDFPRIEALLQQKLFAPGDEVVFLQADICRADLMVEIEATVFIPSPSAPSPA